MTDHLSSDPRNQSVGIIGAGAAGLITAHTLLQDGFSNIQIITRDETPGGVWAAERVYPGLRINNVHGEYRFTPLKMDYPSTADVIGGRLTGDDMRLYMTTFADKFLKGKIRFGTEVLKISRETDVTGQWAIEIQDKHSQARETLRFSRVVLCSGGCSTPKIPDELSPGAAKAAGFRGMVVHPITFGADVGSILHKVKALPAKTGAEDEDPESVVVVGCGKSAQDIAAYLANEGRKVTVVFEITDAFVAAGKKPLPDFMRKSRLLSALVPHIELRTPLERFFHNTWLGSKIVHYVWNMLTEKAFRTFSVPKDSPLRRARSPFWAIRANDEGIARSNSFHALVTAGKIQVASPMRVVGFAQDEVDSVVLSDGSKLRADVLIVATGYRSSWDGLFDERTAEELGILKKRPDPDMPNYEWNYKTLKDGPHAHRDAGKWILSIYRGMVPAKNILRRDFAICGATISPNNGYAWEVCAHWISSYFLGDEMRLPASVKSAQEFAERDMVWLQKRYPYVVAWENPSISSGITFWNWPQATDELLADMGLRTRRSGGNWLTWPFQVIDVMEIATLKSERDARRLSTRTN
ncbi:FAD/NAD(P)-binding domain-containing protein [Mycena sp. CBHHK59/15]|nr:FAD/NAD(P)-binding domain-containing protein [Mycena sp. CBHHK59/15]